MKTIRKIELRYRRVLLVKEDPNVYDAKVSTSDDAATVIRLLIGSEIVEHFVVLHLTVKNQVISFELVAKGSVAQCSLTPADIFRAAIVSGAASIIIGHNHPSGELVPSLSDIELTKRLMEASRILGIRILDHIIVAEDKAFSMEGAGMLQVCK